jgi:hypothetical protein
MYDVVQIGGSLLILGGFLAAMAGWVAQSSYMYLSLNAVGSAALTATAVISAEAGFILLEGVWALVSVFSIGRKLTGRTVGGAH